MIRPKAAAGPNAWIPAAQDSLLGAFARGILKARDAVLAAIPEPWSNGQTEGQVTRLKVVKRQMYGHANLHLLEGRLIGAA